MQSLFSVFRRPAPPTNFAERRRSSATPASVSSVAYNDTQPRHLGQSESAASAPPKPAAKAPVPPPPRSRQVSPKQSVEIPSTGSRAEGRDVGQGAPLYVAVYASGQAKQSKAMWDMVLHLAAEQGAGEVVKYSCRYDEASNNAGASQRTCETWKVDSATEKDLIARVLIGHVPKTGGNTTTDTSDFEHKSTQITNLLSTFPLSQTTTSSSGAETHNSRAWLIAAITALRTSGLLHEMPSSTTNTPATSSSTTKSTDTTKSTNPPPSRPDLISRPTDNWNDLPADFLSPDAPPGGSHRRKMRNSTPRITPKSSSGQLGELSGAAAAKPPVAGKVEDGSVKREAEEAQEVKSAEEILTRAEEWAEKCQQERIAGEGKEDVQGGENGRAGGRVRTLDVRSGLEVDG